MTGAGLQDKVVLITGGSRGIGRAIASGFAAAGAKVMLTGRDEGSLVRAVDEINGDVGYVVGNAGDPDHAAAAVRTTLGRFDGLDVLVNNAATSPYYGDLIDVDLPRFRKTFAVNLEGPLAFVQAAWRGAMKDRGGSVLNVASIGAFGHSGPVPVYDLTKSTLIHMTQRLANELGPKVRVNAVAPGLIETEFSRALWEEQAESPWPWALARLGVPEDVTGAALFLSSDAASWITGAVLTIDGGAVVGREMF